MANKNEGENLSGNFFGQLQDKMQGGRGKPPAGVSGSSHSLRENSVANGGSTDTLSSDEVIAIRGRLRLRSLQKGKQPMEESSEGDEERWCIHNREINQNKDDQDEEDDGGDEEAQEVEEGEKEADDQRPKLPKDFYEVEAIRKKSKFMGVTHYYIKWLDYPESSNTWEPINNLEGCTGLIDAFEKERSQSGKRKSGRRGKSRQGVTSQPQSKNKNQEQKPQQPVEASLPSGAIMESLNAVETGVGGGNDEGYKEMDLPSGDIMESLNAVETEVGGGNDEGAPRQVNENVSVRDFSQDEGNKELDLSIIKNIENMDISAEVSVHVQEPAAPESVALMNEVASGDGNGASESGRLIGARRRKSGAVKRFNPESSSRAVDNAQDETIRTSTNKIQIYGLDPNDPECPPLTKVTKCLEYYSASASNTTQEVAASFWVLRADGKEVFVSYKYLKTHYPLLLIDFFEQHFRFNATE